VRLFIALDVSEQVRARVAEAVTREQATVDAKWARTEGLHITVVFFGDVKPEKLPEIISTTTRVAARHAKLALEIKGAGTFSGKSPRVLWLGVAGEGDALTALAIELGKELGVVSEHPDYTPHLTLARAMHVKGDPMLNEVARRLERKKFGSWEVDHLTVYESAGGRYRPLAVIPLGG
jgi:2'-5' RNA ligase